jgi:hypothetical protein
MAHPSAPATTGQRPAPTAATIRTWRRISRFAQQGWVATFLEVLEHQLSAQILDAGRGGSSSRPFRYWLLRYRPQIRRVGERKPAAAIRLYLLTCTPSMRPIAVALLGHCVDRTNTYNLLVYATTESAQTRRRAARALWRAEAWSQLRSLIATSPGDERIAY